MKNTATSTQPQLVLASGSRYRRQLLEKLGLEIRQDPADIDESRLGDELPGEMAGRLSLAKARAVAPRHPRSLIIASDQVAELEGRPLGKPGNLTTARAQLLASSGKAVTFHTGLCLLNNQTGHYQLDVDRFTVFFRELSEQQIEHYLQREDVLDCAGSFKSEGLGIALFDKLQGDDPNSLIGLPLIRLVEFLSVEGFSVL